MAQKKRAKKTSQGINGGGGKTRLSIIEKALISRTYFAPIHNSRRERVNSDAGRIARAAR